MNGMVIQYGYKYEKEYGVYNVRRLDDECLDYHIPYGLLLSLYYGSGINFKGEKVANLNNFVHFNTDCTRAIVDFKKKDYTLSEVDFIVGEIESKQILTL